MQSAAVSLADNIIVFNYKPDITFDIVLPSREFPPLVFPLTEVKQIALLVKSDR